ncbi:MAG: hypothetical protein RL072_815 [Actinomycetota bacterium]
MHTGCTCAEASENYCDFVSELTGPFDTSKLPRIAPGSVTVTIARTVKPGRSADFTSWSDEMLRTVRAAPGCLGATMLHPGQQSDEYHIIFRFIDALHLRQWERSAERNQLLAQSDDLIQSERVTVTAGDEEFFSAQTQVAPHRTKIGGFLSEVAWVYPLALGFTILLGPALSSLSVFLRALIFTALIGLTSRLAVAPFRIRWHRRRMLPQDQRVQK